MPWPGGPGAVMQVTGVRLTARENNRVTLEARIGAATGDGQALQLTDLAVTTPEGATLVTAQASWDGAQQCLRAPGAVEVTHAGGTLLAPGATLFARTGELALDGPVRGQAWAQQASTPTPGTNP